MASSSVGMVSVVSGGGSDVLVSGVGGVSSMAASSEEVVSVSEASGGGSDASGWGVGGVSSVALSSAGVGWGSEVSSSSACHSESDRLMPFYF